MLNHEAIDVDGQGDLWEGFTVGAVREVDKIEEIRAFNQFYYRFRAEFVPSKEDIEREIQSQIELEGLGQDSDINTKDNPFHPGEID